MNAIAFEVYDNFFSLVVATFPTFGQAQAWTIGVNLGGDRFSIYRVAPLSNPIEQAA